MEAKPVYIEVFSKKFAEAIRKTYITGLPRYYTYYSKSLEQDIESHAIWKDQKTGQVFVEDLIAETVYLVTCKKQRERKNEAFKGRIRLLQP